MSQDIDVVYGVIRRAYGGDLALSVQTTREIERGLLEVGWLRPRHVRGLVASAGGEILVTPRFLIDPPETLIVWKDAVTGGLIVRTE